LGKGDEALREYRQARDLRTSLVKDHPDLPAYRQELARTYDNLGRLLSDQGQWDEALRAYQQAQNLLGGLVKDYPDRPLYRQELARAHQNLAVLLSDQGQRDEALGEYRQARDLLGGLVKDNPDVFEYQVDLAHTSLNRASLLAQLNRLHDCLQDLDECVRLTSPQPPSSPRRLEAATLHLSGLTDRSVVLLRLKRIPEAEADWQRVLKLTPPAERIDLRVRRAHRLARAGIDQYAAPEVDELDRDKTLPASTLYDLGCIHALNAASANGDQSRPLPVREKQAERYARQAVAALRRAQAAGFFRDPAQVEHLDQDTDLTFLRDHDDYRAFRAALKPAEP
jgi:tetratricopeptide (TPR) repeat protein